MAAQGNIGRSPEPWLRGALPGVAPHIQPVLHSFLQVREDLARWTDGLTDEEIWSGPSGLPSLGFQLRHIAGSVDRLTTYLMGGELDVGQLDFLRREAEPGASLSELLADVEAALAEAEAQLQEIGAESLAAPRLIGRKRLPSTVLGLLVHLAEHTQRHLGQAITTAKLLRALRAGQPQV